MFGDRCDGLSGCGHTTNWTVPCTCDEVYKSRTNDQPALFVYPPLRKPTIQDVERWLQHDVGCSANDLDPMDHTPCTCGLRAFYNPWNRKEPQPEPEPLVEVAREMVLLDGVVRTDNQKAAIREGRAANIASDDFYDRLRAALAARGLKLVEVGDA